MKYRFCGGADCPDWVLAEINSLSKLSSIKLKLLVQVIAKGIINPPIDMEKAEKLFADSKLDQTVDLKACIACVNYILISAVKYNSNHNILKAELQMLGLPAEHGASFKKVMDEQSKEMLSVLKSKTLKVNALEGFSSSVDVESNCVNLELKINDETRNVIMTPYTLNVLLENLKSVRNNMQEMNNNPFTYDVGIFRTSNS
ncbi:PREDICTED: COMM domain-containing protein 4 [Nicrophorus vespilloides]|uniref:COMM domain-containing protein 4 n=1 Tax=Nicrophorus vespilloides TaxID=110193 RepID=A0ABM1MXA9_NICVS|nr:PREDICTED: COMM domain-containing protein 4 [Nicrophorus vespilloides]